MPTVTVIIPVYKVERYLDACVESVVRQSYADLEILLVDDGSPDRCPALCDAWAEKDPRIKVIHRENGGLSAARNSGIDAAMGEFLLFVDSDDLLEPDAVRRAVDAQRQQDADLVIFNLTYVDEANRPLPQPDFSGFTDEILDEDGVWQRCFALAETRIYYVVAWNKLYRRSLFQHLRYAPGKRYEDQFLLPHLLAQCKTIACLAAPGYRYVQRSGSIMAQGSSRTYLDRPEYLLDWCAYFTQKGDALRAEGLLNDAIQNLAEKQCFDLSTPAQQARYRAACRACADSYTALAAATGQRSMRLRAALLRIGLPAYQAFLKHKTSGVPRMEKTQLQNYHVHYGPAQGWSRVDLRELWRYKDLIWLFVKRDFNVMYKQTVLGPAWILINPLMSTAMYCVMFGTIAQLSTDGVPQILFYLAGTALWGFFSSCINKVSGTFTTNSNIFSKVYFPRLAMPISTVISGLINFLVQFALFFILLLVYLAKGEVSPHWGMLLLCVPLVLQVGLLGLGCGIIVSSLTTRYRDLMVVVTFGVQLWMYGSPVVYPLSMITHPVLRAVMVINPMTAPMESFRYIFFGTGQVTGVMWASSLIWTVALLALGLSLFSKVEKTFVDTV